MVFARRGFDTFPTESRCETRPGQHETASFPRDRSRDRAGQQQNNRGGLGSPRLRSGRRMDFGSVTMARSFILPLQVGHARTSMPRHLLRSSAQGMYRLPVLGGGNESLAGASGGLGTRRGRGLAGRGEDTRVAHGVQAWRRGDRAREAREQRERVEVNGATVPSARPATPSAAALSNMVVMLRCRERIGELTAPTKGRLVSALSFALTFDLHPLKKNSLNILPHFRSLSPQSPFNEHSRR
jgi:hypothetical protein